MVYLHIAQPSAKTVFSPLDKIYLKSVMQARFEVAEVLRANWAAVACGSKFNSWQLRTLNAVKRCRTAALGSHVDACSDSKHTRICYNTCRNGHCLKCQGSLRENWIQAWEDELLPVLYFHVVYTLPDKLNKLCLFKPSVPYSILFKTAWSTLNSFGNDRKWRGANRNDQYSSHLGTNHGLTSAPALHRARRWLNETGEMENC